MEGKVLPVAYYEFLSCGNQKLKMKRNFVS